MRLIELYNVNFKTEQALYDKFRIVCIINKEKLQDRITKLIENFVIENKELLENPEIKKKIQPKLPTFYGKQEEWAHYVRRLDKEGFEKMATRVTFLRFLLHDHVINKHDDIELQIALKNKEFFQKSKDYKFLSNGIYSAVQQMNRVL